MVLEANPSSLCFNYIITNTRMETVHIYVVGTVLVLLIVQS